MSRTIVLDTGPLGLITNPKRSEESLACAYWLQGHITAGSRIIIPEIADYEIRRELLRASKIKGVARLDDLIKALEYLPITTASMRQAAHLWAEARQQGQPTAGDKTIDGDIILVAQTMALVCPEAIIATTNVGHLSRFFSADLWRNIPFTG